ncbi:MAG: hypothetical protein HOP29_20015, partial [Phycisphaerales bacterium]|nr:hypothetical protein [Phycisphaerales bacterium]
CDDGNAVGGDGCSPTCGPEGACCLADGSACMPAVSEDTCIGVGWYLGNGSACPIDLATCPRCGDGAAIGSEECDNGGLCENNATPCSVTTAAVDCAGIGGGTCTPRSGDGCDANCRTEGACCAPDGSCVNTRGIFCLPADREDFRGNGLLCGAVVCAVCGDGVQERIEECDDNNTAGNDGCSGVCVDEICGDGIVQNGIGEQCDDGGTANNDGCRATCIIEFCGDGTTQNGIGEQCDDGGTANNDGCSATCVTEFCGDGTVNNIVEQCDDGGTVSNDGCTSTCRTEFCGDGVRQTGLGEACDAAGESASCDPNCTTRACGDGFVNVTGGEECDPPDGVLCSVSCLRLGFPIAGNIFRGNGATLATGRTIAMEFRRADDGALLDSINVTDGTYQATLPPNVGEVSISGTITANGPGVRFVANNLDFAGINAGNNDGPDFTVFYDFFVDRDGVGGVAGNNGSLGTATAPKASIQSATDGVFPGDTVTVRQGVYASESNSQATPAVLVPVTRSGTAGRPIVIQGLPGETPIIDGTARGSDSRDTVRIQGSHIVFQNFEIRNARRGAVVVEAPAEFVTVRLCEAHNNDRDNTFIGGTFRGEGTISNIIIEDCIAYENVAGFEFREVPTRTSTQSHVPPIDGNDGFVGAGDLAEANWDAWPGWTQYAARDSIVRRCIAYRNQTIAEHSDGFKNRYGVRNVYEDNIAFENADDGIDGVGATRSLYRRNIAFNHDTPVTEPLGDGDGNGIKVGVRGGLENVFYQNVSFRNHRGGIDLADTERAIVFNNTVYANIEWFGIWNEANRANASGAEYHNNLGVENATINSRGDIGADGQVSILVFDNNAVSDENDHNWARDVGPEGFINVNPMFADPDFVMDTNFPAGSSIPQKLAFIRDQVYTALRLLPTSPLVDQGTFVIRTTAAGVATTVIPVNVDPRDYFLVGDLIQVDDQDGVVGTRVRAVIQLMTANSITVDTAITFPNGAGVHPPYNGNLPDIGALEAPEAP